jgi:hypothetical protein
MGCGKSKLDKMTSGFHFVCVQLGVVAYKLSECKRDLDSKLQQRLGAWLNTSRLAYAVCGAVSLRIAPSGLNRLRWGFFSYGWTSGGPRFGGCSC